MEKLYKEGKVRAIGVSNFYPDRLTDLTLHNEIKPAVNQIEVNPFCQQIEHAEYNRNYNVQVEAWSTLATGRYDIFQQPILMEIAKKYHKSVAQICLRWVIQRGMVAIPKASSKEHMLNNLDVFDFELKQEDIDKIEEINTETSVYFGKLSHRDPETVKQFAEMKFSTW